MFKLSRSSSIILVAFITTLFVVSAFAVAPETRAASAQTTANLNSITFIDYGGNDASGVADLQAGKTDAYDFSLTPSASASLGSNFNQYVAPASIYGLYVNPQNTSAGTGNYNPFYFQKVRFALNYLIDRTYFAQTIEGGKFVPCVSAVCAEPDAATAPVAAAVAPFSNVTFNFQFANHTIYSVLTAQKGVSYTAGHYYFATVIEGHKTTKAVTINLFDRIDDPIRHAFMQYLNSQLQKIGFNTNVITGTLSDAYVTVFGTDPANASYDIYPASNSQIWGYYDSNGVNFYSAGYYNDLPASDHYGSNWIGGWDNKTQEPYSVQLWDNADKLGAIPLLTSAFTTLHQRSLLLANLTYYGVLGATYITLGTSLAPYAASSAVTGVTPNFLVDPFANYQNSITWDVSASGAAASAHNLKLGVRHVTNGAVNPVGGDDDAYSDNVLQTVNMPLFSYGPSLGYQLSTGVTYVSNGNDPTADIPVPTTALVFNGSADSWQHTAANTKAQNDVTVDFSKILANTKWADGTPVTLADFLFQYAEEQLVVSSSGPLYDPHMAAVYTSLSNAKGILGIQVVNATAMRIWTTTSYFTDTNLAAIGVIASIGEALGYAGNINGAGIVPWQLYYAMNQVVSNHQAAWSTSQAKKLGLPWLSLINPSDVANVKAALTAGGTTIPPEISQLQTLTGQNWVTSASAGAGFTAAVNFITTNGVAVIGDGPFYISSYSASTSPAFLVVTKSPYFQAAGVGDPRLFAPAIVLTAQAAIPPILSPGGSFSVNVLQTIDGSKTSSPASGATVIVQFVSGGHLASSATYTSSSSGAVQVQVPSSLSAGQYLLSISTFSDTTSLVQPVVQSVTLTAPVTTTTTTPPTTTTTPPTTTTTPPTTSTTPPTTSTSSTTTTATTDYTPYIYGGIVVVIIIVIAVALARRRGGGATT